MGTIGAIDLTMPVAVMAALCSSILQPLYLLGTKHIRFLANRHGLRFLASAVTTFIFWSGTILIVPAFAPSTWLDIIIGAAVISGLMLFYLEIWGLLTRGYTLGILLTLLRANRPLEAREISNSYRGGEGLEWIMRHRLAGLSATGLISVHDGKILLTPLRGVPIARIYAFCIAVLGLRRTG
jgi:hypothetical protein